MQVMIIPPNIYWTISRHHSKGFMSLTAFNHFRQNNLKLRNKAKGPHQGLSKSANLPKHLVKNNEGSNLQFTTVQVSGSK